jgi:hypothetical protein
MVRGSILAVVAFAALSVAHAADLEGVSMLEMRVMDGTTMRLNGIGLRTYSILGIPIYVAGLYLERRSDDPDTILCSPERKLLDIRFLRDVGVEDARTAWRDAFKQNCKAPCYLDPGNVQRFLAARRSAPKGDESTLLSTAKGVAVTFNRRPLGEITDPRFAEVVLGTFIGAEPPTPRLKRELLGVRD